MKFAIIGTGGVGGYYGGLLARAGEKVTFVARGEHFNVLSRNGLSLHSVDVNFDNLPVDVVDSVDKLDKPDVVLVCTKTYDRDEVAQQLAAVISNSTVIISIQNGIDNDLQIKKLLPAAQVYPGLAYIISERSGFGVIKQTAGPRTIIFGERNSVENPVLKEIEAVMRRATILATAAPNIEHELWTKFLWITTFAGMTALCRCSIGLIVNDPETFELYVRCLDEGISVANKLGLQFGDSERSQIIEKSEHYKKVGSHAKSSLLVDIENRRRTEIDALNGTMVRIAKENGLRVPIHETIYNAVKLASDFYLERANN